MRDTGEIRRAIAQVVPGFSRIADLDQTGQEFHIAGRIFHTPQFKTDDGRAHLHSHRLPDVHVLSENQFRLMTVRSEGQFNTVVYEESDLYRGVERRDVILMHPDDMARLGLTNEVRVRVVGEAGTMVDIQARTFPEIRPGNVLMYYPEANVLIGRDLDPRSKTPAFKGSCVKIEAM